MCFIVKLYSETFMFQRCDILTHAVCPSQTVINKNIQMRHSETLNRFQVILMFLIIPDALTCFVLKHLSI